MSSPEPSPGDADTAQTVSRNHVVITGAGFTRALVPGAPLLVDDFSNDVLEARVRGLPNASRLLDWERSLDERGRIDIERLMTRLDALMPYDYAESAGNAANEYGFSTARWCSRCNGGSGWSRSGYWRGIRSDGISPTAMPRLWNPAAITKPRKRSSSNR